MASQDTDILSSLLEMIRSEMIRSVAPCDEVDGSKPEVRPGVHITLKVVDTELRRVHYTMRRTDTLHGLMDLYYASVPDVSYGSGKFLFDGSRVRGCQTPADFLMEDDDMVYFFPDLVGGGGHGSAPAPASAHA